jgi:peroxiredoxin
MTRTMMMMMSAILLAIAYVPAVVAERSQEHGGMPGVGDSLATLAARDQSGGLRNAASLIGPNGAVITFLRSAEWCPSCKVQLVELEAARTRLSAAGYGLAAVTIDDVPVLSAFAAERKIGFPLLSGRQAIAALKMVDPRFNDDPQRRGAPHPTVYVVNRALQVQHAFPESERNTVASMLARLAMPGVPAERHETPHLTAAAWASDQEVAGNRRFSLIVDVSPKTSMHVYAPGTHQYKSIALIVDSIAGLTVEPTEFPKSEPYVFKALNETVPVYAKPFRLIQDVMLAPAGKGSAVPAQTVRLTGRLVYQACDDVVCYPVKTVPLAWKVQLN